MTTVNVSSIYNVEASVTAWLRTGLTAISSLPTWLPTPKFVTNWPEIASYLTAATPWPVISAVHLPGHALDRWQGRGNVGSGAVEKRGILQVDCWVNRDAKVSGQIVWQAQLRYLEAMVEQVYAQTGTINILGYAASATAPTSTGNRVVLGDMHTESVQQDPNPAIERRRILMDYWWVLKA